MKLPAITTITTTMTKNNKNLVRKKNMLECIRSKKKNRKRKIVKQSKNLLSAAMDECTYE